MEKPSPSFSMVMVQVVSRLSAFSFDSPSTSESAIVKQPAWAAASNSSGLVPLPCSKRLLNEYGVEDSTPLAVETWPPPDVRSPAQWADPVRFIFPPLDGQHRVDAALR